MLTEKRAWYRRCPALGSNLSQAKRKATRLGCFLFGGEGEMSCRKAATHCWCYCIILRKRNFARILRRLPLVRLPSSSAGGGRLTPSRASVARVQIFPAKAKSTPFGVLCFGGEGEIRTLEPLLTVTRFPVVRPRPTRRHLQSCSINLSFITTLDYYTKSKQKNQYLF